MRVTLNQTWVQPIPGAATQVYVKNIQGGFAMFWGTVDPNTDATIFGAPQDDYVSITPAGMQVWVRALDKVATVEAMGI